jgi:hypothetical protein
MAAEFGQSLVERAESLHRTNSELTDARQKLALAYEEHDYRLQARCRCSTECSEQTFRLCNPREDLVTCEDLALRRAADDRRSCRRKTRSSRPHLSARNVTPRVSTPPPPPPPSAAHRRGGREAAAPRPLHGRCLPTWDVRLEKRWPRWQPS